MGHRRATVLFPSDVLEAVQLDRMLAEPERVVEVDREEAAVAARRIKRPHRRPSRRFR